MRAMLDDEAQFGLKYMVRMERERSENHGRNQNFIN
jgi:hypothetical protein